MSGLDRRAVVAAILEGRDEVLAIGGLGGAGYDVTAARGDHDLNFCMHGAMGGAPLVAMGVALAQPARRVVSILGDGDMIMGLSGLATIATMRPENLAVIVLDNGHYQETGNQLTASGFGTDLAGMAAAAGFRVTRTFGAGDELADVADAALNVTGPVFLLVKINQSPVPPVPKTRDGNYMKIRFRKALLGEEPL